MQAPVAEHEFALSPRNSPARSKGWTLIRTRGGHNVWKSPDGSQTLAIPRHEQTQTDQRTFDAIASREGRWWLVRVPALDAVTQARSIKEVSVMATDLVAALLDVDDHEVIVNVTYELPATVANTWAEAEAGAVLGLSKQRVQQLAS